MVIGRNETAVVSRQFRASDKFGRFRFKNACELAPGVSSEKSERVMVAGRFQDSGVQRRRPRGRAVHDVARRLRQARSGAERQPASPRPKPSVGSCIRRPDSDAFADIESKRACICAAARFGKRSSKTRPNALGADRRRETDWRASFTRRKIPRPRRTRETPARTRRRAMR